MFKTPINKIYRTMQQNNIHLTVSVINNVLQAVIAGICMVIIYFVIMFFINAQSLYSNALNETITNMSYTYKRFGYDFLHPEKPYIKEIPRMANRLVDEFTYSGMYKFFLFVGFLSGINLFIGLISVAVYMTRSGLYLFFSGTLVLILVIIIFHGLVTFESTIKYLAFHMLNSTDKYRKDYTKCSICFMDVGIKNNSHFQLLNTMAFSLYVFKCCGIKSYKDMKYTNKIPLTCCSRKNYSIRALKSSNECEIEDIYSPCLGKLTNFMLNYSTLNYLRTLWKILLMFNMLCATVTFFYAFQNLQLSNFFCKKRKDENHRRFSNALGARLSRESFMTLNQIPSFLTNEQVSTRSVIINSDYNEDNGVEMEKPMKKYKFNFPLDNKNEIISDYLLKSTDNNQIRSSLLLKTNASTYTKRPSILIDTSDKKYPYLDDRSIDHNNELNKSAPRKASATFKFIALNDKINLHNTLTTELHTVEEIPEEAINPVRTKNVQTDVSPSQLNETKNPTSSIRRRSSLSIKTNNISTVITNTSKKHNEQVFLNKNESTINNEEVIKAQVSINEDKSKNENKTSQIKQSIKTGKTKENSVNTKVNLDTEITKSIPRLQSYMINDVFSEDRPVISTNSSPLMATNVFKKSQGLPKSLLDRSQGSSQHVHSSRHTDQLSHFSRNLDMNKPKVPDVIVHNEPHLNLLPQNGQSFRKQRSNHRLHESHEIKHHDPRPTRLAEPTKIDPARRKLLDRIKEQ